MLTYTKIKKIISWLMRQLERDVQKKNNAAQANEEVAEMALAKAHDLRTEAEEAARFQNTLNSLVAHNE